MDQRVGWYGAADAGVSDGEAERIGRTRRVSGAIWLVTNNLAFAMPLRPASPVTPRGHSAREEGGQKDGSRVGMNGGTAGIRGMVADRSPVSLEPVSLDSVVFGAAAFGCRLMNASRWIPVDGCRSMDAGRLGRADESASRINNRPKSASRTPTRASSQDETAVPRRLSPFVPNSPDHRTSTSESSRWLYGATSGRCCR